jgi:hypothetical protein
MGNNPAGVVGKRPGLYIAVVNLDKAEKRATYIMNKDLEHLLRAVKQGKLDKNGSDALRGYLKLIKDIKVREKQLEEAVSDEDLNKVAKGSP